jgi:hypothetical protein
MGVLCVVGAVAGIASSVLPDDWKSSPTPIVDGLFVLSLGLASLAAARAIRERRKWWWLLQIIAFIPVESFFLLLALGEVRL